MRAPDPPPVASMAMRPNSDESPVMQPRQPSTRQHTHASAASCVRIRTRLRIFARQPISWALEGQTCRAEPACETFRNGL